MPDFICASEQPSVCPHCGVEEGPYGCACPDPADTVECQDCNGEGTFVDCIDDLCYGQDQCIHGDDPSPCRTCKGTGYR